MFVASYINNREFAFTCIEINKKNHNFSNKTNVNTTGELIKVILIVQYIVHLFPSLNRMKPDIEQVVAWVDEDGVDE